MGNEITQRSVLVVPCSGIGKVHGLISREATYLVTDELAPKQTDTLCLALLVKGDPEAVSAVQNHACITIDGCAKLCAQKNVEMAGGQVAKAPARLTIWPAQQLDRFDAGILVRKVD